MIGIDEGLLTQYEMSFGHSVFHKSRQGFISLKKKTRCCCIGFSFSGAGDEARTRYLHLGKVALYRMSYTRKLVPTVGIEFLRFQYQQPSWCLRSESNQRHVDFQSTALPTELQRHFLDQRQALV